MTDSMSSSKGKKTQKSLDEEIATLEEKVKRLKQRKAEKEQKDLEKNQRSIYALLRTEKLDAIPVEGWSKVLPQLRRLLRTENEAHSVKAEPSASKSSKGGAGLPAGDSSRKADPVPSAPAPIGGLPQEEPAAA